MSDRGVAPRPVQPLEALRAMRALIADPDNTTLVFQIIRALTGESFERLYQRVLTDPVGRTILDEKRDILLVLKDRGPIRALPDGTLGREYARYLDREGITPEGLVEASEDIEDPAIFLDERAHVLSRRLRDTHDLWHIVTGYQRDVFGEVALLAFTYAQIRNHGIGFIVAMASLRMLTEGHFDGLRLTWDALWRGTRAGSFVAADWEALLEMPLNEVREMLRVGDLPTYTPLFSAAATAAH